MNLLFKDGAFPTLDFADLTKCTPEELRYRLTWLYWMHDAAVSVRADCAAEHAPLSERLRAAMLQRVIDEAIEQVTAQLRVWARRGGHGVEPLPPIPATA